MNELMNEWLNIYLTDLAKNMRTDLVGPARWKTAFHSKFANLNRNRTQHIEILLLHVLFNYLFLTFCIATIHPFSPIFKPTE